MTTWRKRDAGSMARRKAGLGPRWQRDQGLRLVRKLARSRFWPRLVTISVVMVGVYGALSLPASPVLGTVVVEVPLEDMVADADAIVEGTVVQSGVRLNLDKGMPDVETVVVIKVSDWMKRPRGLRGRVLPDTRNPVAPDTITLTEPGGDVAGLADIVLGAPVYTKDEQVIVFLKQDGRHHKRPLSFGGTTYSTYDMSLGKFVVLPTSSNGEPLVRRDGRDLMLATWGPENSFSVSEPGQFPVMMKKQFRGLVEKTLDQIGYNVGRTRQTLSTGPETGALGPIRLVNPGPGVQVPTGADL